MGISVLDGMRVKKAANSHTKENSKLSEPRNTVGSKVYLLKICQIKSIKQFFLTFMVHPSFFLTRYLYRR